MKSFEGILICTDLDGTILRDDKTVSEENREAIEYFKSEGGYFTFITGRMPYFAKDIYEMIKPNAPIGCINGGGIYDFEKRASQGVFCIRLFFVCREFPAWFAVLRFIFRWIFVYGGIRVGLLIGTFCVVRRGFRLMFGCCFVFCCTGQLADFDFRCFGVENYLIRKKNVPLEKFMRICAAHFSQLVLYCFRAIS